MLRVAHLQNGTSSPRDKNSTLPCVTKWSALRKSLNVIDPAYLLLMQDLFTFKDLRKALHLVTHGRVEFLSRGGLGRSVGERLGADSVDRLSSFREEIKTASPR